MDLRIGKKVAGLAASAIMASALVAPAAAMADDGYSYMDSAHIPGAQTPSANVATGAACRAAMPSLEILGINSIEETGTFSYLVNGMPQYVWEQPKYILAASLYNQTPSPYLANLATGNASAAIVNTSRAGGGAGPNAALDIQPTSETHTQDSSDKDVLDLNPDVIVGNANGNVQYIGYYGLGYEPGVNYNASNYTTLENSMLAIAGAVQSHNAVEGATPLTGRYGDPTSIANEYGRYIDNLTAYVADRINENTKRTVVLINGYEPTGDEDDPYVYSLLSYDASGAGDGTASQNRYLETVQSVAYNYADRYDVTELSSAELVERVTGDNPSIDLIMVGGQQNSGQNDAIVNALIDDGLINSTYFVQGNGSHGSQYGVVMNSVENAQNVGRILGCLYDDIFEASGITQADLVAFYYQEFYHINQGELGTVMGEAMDGVRNWAVVDAESIAEATEWTAANSYNLSAVYSIVNPGQN